MCMSWMPPSRKGDIIHTDWGIEHMGLQSARQPAFGLHTAGRRKGDPRRHPFRIPGRKPLSGYREREFYCWQNRKRYFLRRNGAGKGGRHPADAVHTSHRLLRSRRRPDDRPVYRSGLHPRPGELALYDDTCHALELNVTCPIPEWTSGCGVLHGRDDHVHGRRHAFLRRPARDHDPDRMRMTYEVFLRSIR